MQTDITFQGNYETLDVLMEEEDTSFSTEYGESMTLMGPEGKSAYQVAVDNGFVGTEKQWLSSLKGKDGANGRDGYTPQKGVDYTDGHTPVKGVDYFDGEKGDKGDKGDKGEKGDRGEQGIQGEKGEDGKNGKDGADGYTPIKGTDYFTDSEKAEMVSDVLAALPVYNGEVTTV